MLFSAPRLQEVWPLYPLMVLSLWLGGCFVISCMGWRSFARKYPSKRRPAGKVHRVPWMKFEFIGAYRKSVRVVFTEEGIHFSAPFLFRVFHAPFLLPWKSVRRIRKKGGFARSRRLVVHVEDAEGPIRLWVSKTMEDDFFKYYQPAITKLPARPAFPKENREAREVGKKMAGEVMQPRS